MFFLFALILPDLETWKPDIAMLHCYVSGTQNRIPALVSKRRSLNSSQVNWMLFLFPTMLSWRSEVDLPLRTFHTMMDGFWPEYRCLGTWTQISHQIGKLAHCSFSAGQRAYLRQISQRFMGFPSKKAIIFDKVLPIPNLHLRRLRFMMELDGEMHR